MGTVDAVEEVRQDAAAVQRRLDDVTAALADPLNTGDVATLTDERDHLTKQLAVLRSRAEAASNAEYRARNVAKQDEFIRRRDGLLREMADHVPQVLLAVAGMRVLLEDATAGKVHAPDSAGTYTAALGGIDPGALDEVLRALWALGVEWDFPNPDERAALPQPQREKTFTVALPASRPIGNARQDPFTGGWEPW